MQHLYFVIAFIASEFSCVTSTDLLSNIAFYYLYCYDMISIDYDIIAINDINNQ